MDLCAEYFPGTVARDFFDLVAGRRLGSGIGREVWTCTLDPTVVIKFETGGGSFQNVVEWEAWQSLRWNEDSSKWLAPCVNISSCGAVLLQKRTEPMRQAELPARVPAWACDLKLENWGMLDGRPVMHDYGLASVIMGRGATKHMKKADWRV
jgi:hypothetical protein